MPTTIDGIRWHFGKFLSRFQHFFTWHHQHWYHYDPVPPLFSVLAFTNIGGTPNPARGSADADTLNSPSSIQPWSRPGCADIVTMSPTGRNNLTNVTIKGGAGRHPRRQQWPEAFPLAANWTVTLAPTPWPSPTSTLQLFVVVQTMTPLSWTTSTPAPSSWPRAMTPSIQRCPW